MNVRLGWVAVACLCLVSSGFGQNSATSSASVSVPPVIQFSNVATDEGGTPLSGTVSITFSLYNTAVGGQDLWSEMQNVQLGSAGQYSVYLGLTQANGLPVSLFSNGQAQWLGVKIENHAEQPRVYLVSVPYAMKAGDAATVGGLPPSAFVMATPGASGTSSASVGGNADSTSPASATSSDVTTSGGTVDYIPLWDATSDITNSVLYQSGSGSTAKIGINTATPASTLDVKGTATLRGTTTVLGTLTLPTTGAATASAGKDSEAITQAASAYNSSTSTPVNQTFEWLAEPEDNDTSTATGTLNLLFGQGTTKPSETGLHIAANGQITFAAGQTFPGTGNGTVMSVGSGTGLTGGPITSSGTLQIDPTVVPELNAASNTFTGSIAASGFTGSGAGLTNVNAATLNGYTSSDFQLVGAYATLGANTFTGNQTVNANIALPNTNSSGTEGVILIGGNAFVQNYGVSGSYNGFFGYKAGNFSTTGLSLTAVGTSALGEDSSGSKNTAVGYLSLFSDTTGSNNTAVGLFAGETSDSSSVTASNNTLLGANALLSTGSLSNAVGIGAYSEVSESNALILGPVSGTNGCTSANNCTSVNVGIGTTAPAYSLDVYGTGHFAQAVTFGSPVNFASGQTFPGAGTITAVNPGTGLSGGGSSGSVTLANTGILSLTAGTGISSSGGQSPTININTSVVPELTSSNTFSATQRINGSLGVNEAPSWPLQVLGSGAETAEFDNTSQTSRIRLNGASGTGGDLIYQAAGTSLFGVYSIAANTLGFYPSDGSTATMFINNSDVGIGTTTPKHPLQVNGADVAIYGDAAGPSVTGATYSLGAGVWGDAGGGSDEYAGVQGSADDNNAGFFYNNSGSDSLLSGSTVYALNYSTYADAFLFVAQGSPGLCEILNSGDLSCNGSINSVVPADGGARRVSLYAVHSTENWFEDAGSGQLNNGSTRIELDPTFAQTVNTGTDYHVFLTPNDDCKGLYVSRKTATSFEVHELGGGHSSIPFDYRIMAKRTGYENVRLKDVTERYQQMQQQMERRRERTQQGRALRTAGSTASSSAALPAPH